MKKSENPFYRLLGVESSRPHHYKLLGISRAADEKQVEIAARDRLKQVAMADTELSFDQRSVVVKAIEKAVAVLKDPDKRKAYDLKMERAEAIAKSKKEGAEGGRRSGDEAFGYTENDLLPPPLPGAQGGSDQTTSSQTGPTESNVAKQVAKPIDMKAEGDIPLAVPLADTEEAESEKSAAEKPADKGAADDPIDWRNADGYDPVSGRKNKDKNVGGNLRVRRRGSARRKRSMLVPLMSMFFFVVGVGGIIYFLFAYMEMYGGSQDVVQPSDVGDAVAKNVGGDVVDPVDGGEPQKEAKGTGGNAGQKGADSKGNDSDDAAKRDAAKRDGAKDDGAKDDGAKDDGAKDGMDGGDGPAEPEPPKTEMRGLSFAEKARFRRLMQRADRNLFQRNFDGAAEAGGQASELFESILSDGQGATLNREAKKMQELALALDTLTGNLRGFWQQVETSGKENDGDIAIREDFITVVEASDDYIIIRRRGSNLRYKYLELPAGLAMALGESGAQEDVPQWNIQKAAFYAVNRQVDLKYRDRAMEFVLLAERDGHDMAYMRNYLAFDWTDVGRPEGSPEQLDRAVQKKLIREMKEEWEIANRIDSLAADECEESLSRLLSEMDQFKEDEDSKRAAICELSRLLAVQAGLVDLALELVDEQRVWAQFDVMELKVETMNDLAGQKLNSANARLCVESYLRFRAADLGDVAAGTKIRKLHDRMTELATREGFSDLVRNLAQL